MYGRQDAIKKTKTDIGLITIYLFNDVRLQKPLHEPDVSGS